ncbi:MAG: DUF2480 family protein [Flavisolibacter sp.]
MSEVFVNKVANSGLVTVDLEKYLPGEEIALFDLKDHLFMGLILKEKDFREALKQLDWSVYEGKPVALTCSVDAIIPVWAYMLVASYLAPVAKTVFTGSPAALQQQLFLKNLESLDRESFRDQRVVIKGCGDKTIEPFAYAAITGLLVPVVKSLMYGEPCSTVPVYKKKP